jgi:hypothetical protein
MTRSLFRSFLLSILLTALVLPLRAGAIIEGDPADGNVDSSVANNSAYYQVYDIEIGNPPNSNGACAMVEAFPLPYLAPGQTVSAATISFYLDSDGSNQSAVDYNMQLYGLNRVSLATAVPLSGTAATRADFYAGKDDTANTLLDATFIPTAPTLSKTYSYSGSNLASFINKQYTNSIFSALGLSNARYIYFRLSPDTEINDGAKFDEIASARNPNRTFHPMLSLTISGGITNTAGSLQFSFNLPQNSQGSYVTSAGVYNPTTGALVRTLWNNIQYQAGMNYGAWDGKDDSGKVLAGGTNYQIKLIYHNVQYVWQGMVGNTSATQVGRNVYRSFEKIHDMTFTGNMGYYSVGYNENAAAFHQFSASTPQVPLELNAGGTLTDPSSSMYYVTSDAAKTYWAKTQGGFSAANTYVIGINNGSNSIYTFPKGTTPPSGQGQYASCVDFDGTAGQPNSAEGIAVQQGASGDLFVSHGNLNVVRVFDKIQGNLLGTIAVTNPGRMATAPNGDVWIISYAATPTVSRYTFANGKGTLDETITGLSNPEGVGVSPDGTLLLVADGGASMQIKAFTNATGVVANTGTPLWTYGTLGGMAGPALTTSSFNFNVQYANTNGFANNEAFVAFNPDGTFWLEDGGNDRYLHFSITGTTLGYIEQITYNDCSYQTTVDLTDATRVFNQFTEYAVNYSLPLGGTNGSWKMVNNWSIGLPNDSTHLYFGEYNGWINVVTLSNGRTYGFLNNFNNNNSQDMFELSASGPARFTGYQFTNNPLIYADGSLRFNVSNGVGPLTCYSAPLTGFDSANNPVWGSAALLASTVLTAANPLPLTTYPMRTEVTASGVVIDFDGNHFDAGYHLGGIALGGTTFKWQASPSSTGTYWFPQDGHFDMGNGVNYAGNYAGVLGRNIIYGYHGELWGGGEASQWVNYLDNGLMVGRFGTYGNINTLNGATPGFAGNSFYWSLVTGPDGNVYLYHGDEANHGGTNRWLITGWDAIAEMNGTAAVGSTVNLDSSTAGPSVTVTSPLNGTVDSNGSSLTLSAQAGGNGAAITSVQFMDGTNSLGSVNVAPFMLNYSGLAAGSHTLTAVATDANGLSTTSAPVSVTISGDGTSAPPPAPTSLSTSDVTDQSVTLNWTEPPIGTTSSTIGNIISFQSDVAGDSNALAPTAVAGVSPYAVADFNLLGQTTGSAVQLNVLNSAGATVANLGINAGILPSSSFNSTNSLTGTTAKLFGSVIQTHSTALSFSIVPYTDYDLVVYSLPGNLAKANESTSLTLTQGTTTSAVTQNFTAAPTTYAVAHVPFGTPTTTLTNINTVVFQGLSTPFFTLAGGNIAGYQIVERPLDQGTPTSYMIQRAAGTSGAFATIGTASGSTTTFIDTSSLNASTSYQYRILAVNSFGTSAGSNTVTVTTSASTAASGTSFASWQSKYFTAEQLADATISGPTEDPYGSGVANLLAYALQLDPATARPTDVPQPVITNGHLTVTYFIPNSITDITYIVEVSPDLMNWNSGAGYTQTTSSVTSANGTTITVQDVTAATVQKHFMRLRVTQNQ